MTAPASPHIEVRPDWLARREETILEPDLPIIDPHHHLWDRPGNRYVLADLMNDLDAGHNVRATVFVQCRTMYRTEGPEALRPVGEVEFVRGIAAQAANGSCGGRLPCAAIVAFADLTLADDVAPVLEALAEAGGGRLRGIRNQTAWHEDPAISSNPVPPKPGLLLHEGFQAATRRLARHGLSLDVWAYHTQLPEVRALARASPDTLIVLDHLGGPLGVGRYAGRREEVFAAWKRDLASLAALPNLRLKLGGLAMKVGGFDFHERALPPSSTELAEAWRPYVETGIELFGPSRAMFESNFPVDKGMVSYPVLWNTFKRLASGFSATERWDLFHDTAARTYGLSALGAS